MSDFLAGRLDLMLNTTGSLLEAVRSKQVRGLAVTSAKSFSGRTGIADRRRVGRARL